MTPVRSRSCSSGLFQGSLYAMMAVGLALVWTTLGMFNFAHGVFMMLGAYVAWQFVDAGRARVCRWPVVCRSPLLAWPRSASCCRPASCDPSSAGSDLVLVAVITTLGRLVHAGERRAADLGAAAEGAAAAGPRQRRSRSASASPPHETAIIFVTPLILGGAVAVPQPHAARPGPARRRRRTRTPASSSGINVTALYALGLRARRRCWRALAGVFFGGFQLHVAHDGRRAAVQGADRRHLRRHGQHRRARSSPPM